MGYEFNVSPEVPIYRIILVRRKFNTNPDNPNGLDLSAFGFPLFMSNYFMMDSEEFKKEVSNYLKNEKNNANVGYDVIILDPMLHGLTEDESLKGFHGIGGVGSQNNIYISYAPSLDLSFTIGELGNSSLSASFVDRDGIFFKPMSVKIKPAISSLAEFDKSSTKSLAGKIKYFYGKEDSAFRDFIEFFTEIGLFDSLVAQIGKNPEDRIGYYFVPPLTPIAVDVYSPSRKMWVRVFSGVITNQSYDVTFKSEVRYKFDAISFADLLYNHTELVDSLFGNFLLTYISSSVKNIKEIPEHISAIVIAFSLVKYVKTLDIIRDNLSKDFRGLTISRNSSLFQYLDLIHRTANVVLGAKYLGLEDLARKFILETRSSIVKRSSIGKKSEDTPVVKVLSFLEEIGKEAGVEISSNTSNEDSSFLNVLKGAISIYNYFVYRFSPLAVFAKNGGLFFEVEWGKSVDFESHFLVDLGKDVVDGFFKKSNVSGDVKEIFGRVGIKIDNAIFRLLKVVAGKDTNLKDELIFKTVFRGGLSDTQISLYSDSYLSVSEVFENIRNQLGLSSLTDNYGNIILYTPRLLSEIPTGTKSVIGEQPKSKLKSLYIKIAGKGISNSYSFYHALPSNIQENIFDQKVLEKQKVSEEEVFGNIFVLDPISGVSSVVISNNYTNSTSRAKIGLSWDLVDFPRETMDLLFTIPVVDPALYFQTKGKDEVTFSVNFITKLQRILNILSSLGQDAGNFKRYLDSVSSGKNEIFESTVQGSSSYKMKVKVDSKSAKVLSFILDLLGVSSNNQDMSSLLTIFPYVYLMWVVMMKNIENNTADFSVYRADPVNLALIGQNIYLPHSNWIGVVRSASYSVSIGGVPEIKYNVGYMVPLPYLQFFPPFSIAEFLALLSVVDIDVSYESIAVESKVVQGVSNDWAKNEVMSEFLLAISQVMGEKLLLFYDIYVNPYKYGYISSST